jgi:hypothetical protein
MVNNCKKEETKLTSLPLQSESIKTSSKVLIFLMCHSQPRIAHIYLNAHNNGPIFYFHIRVLTEYEHAIDRSAGPLGRWASVRPNHR